MRSLVKTPAGSFTLATVVVLLVAVSLFGAASATGNDIIRYYLFGASASALGCSMLLFGASTAFRRCGARSAPDA